MLSADVPVGQNSGDATVPVDAPVTLLQPTQLATITS